MKKRGLPERSAEHHGETHNIMEKRRISWRSAGYQRECDGPHDNQPTEQHATNNNLNQHETTDKRTNATKQDQQMEATHQHPQGLSPGESPLKK